jgi:hypothetical protein
MRLEQQVSNELPPPQTHGESLTCQTSARLLALKRVATELTFVQPL